MLLCVFVGVLFLSFSSADVVSTSSLSSGECAGSITLHQGEQAVRFTEGVEEMEESMMVDRAVMVGCGDCFRLFEKKNGRGRSYFVNRSGEHTIPLRKVRSIHKVPCSNMAMPMWVVIIMVLVMMMVVGMGTMVGVKKYRNCRYNNVTTDEV
eukprot:TRINITY_DN28483_c0_g1_i1.p1 TRINITY_DN28483_c0_g1~~TRINITY_DN28483_c0_g1_i1.p1  ORF type:complete len:152 (-),score=54.11 TRINITY_DN28483_c0_g1_i1:65-520(-)